MSLAAGDLQTINAENDNHYRSNYQPKDPTPSCTPNEQENSEKDRAGSCKYADDVQSALRLIDYAEYSDEETQQCSNNPQS